MRRWSRALRVLPAQLRFAAGVARSLLGTGRQSLISRRPGSPGAPIPHSPVVNASSPLTSDSNPPAASPAPAREKPARRRRRWLWLAPIALLVVGGVSYLFADKPAKSKPAGPEARRGGGGIPVLAARATQGEIGVYLNGLGSVTPIESAVLKSRVDGQLMKVLFTEGQAVREGDLLAEIDPRPFVVQVAQAEGQLLRDEADLRNAILDLERSRTLWEKRAISQQAVAAQEAAVGRLEGAVKSGRAQLDQAKLNLDYSRITAPISGRVGLRQVNPGNMIRAGDTGGLLSIAQMQPISAVFSIPQDQLPAVFKKLKAGEKLAVEAYDRAQKTRLAHGALLSIDNQIDPGTGTLKCKAVFPNDDEALFPHQFVNIRLLVETKRGVTLVPTAAVQRGAQQSTFIYVVTERPAKDGAASAPEQTVAVRYVTLGTSEGDFVEIQDGIQPGDVVVIEGVDRLQDGTKVTVLMKDGASSTAEAAAGAPNGQRGRAS